MMTGLWWLWPPVAVIAGGAVLFLVALLWGWHDVDRATSRGGGGVKRKRN